MPTPLTLIASDKQIHAVDMPADYDKYVCVEHATRKLAIKSKRDIYFENGFNRNITFVPLFGMTMPKDSVESFTETKVVTPPPTTTTNTTRTKNPPTVVNNMTGNILTTEGWMNLNVYPPTVAGQTLENTLTAEITKNGGTGSWSGMVVNVSWPTLKTVTETTTYTVYMNLSDVFMWAPPNAGSRNYSANGSFTVTFYPDTVTSTSTTTQPSDVVTQWMRYNIPPIFTTGLPSEWTYNLSDLVTSGDTILSFLAYVEAQGKSEGTMMVGYDTSPPINYLMAMDTASGSRLPYANPTQLYTADSARGFLVDIAVPTGTSTVKITYLTGKSEPEKTYMYIYGYTKSANLNAYMGNFSYGDLDISSMSYSCSALNLKSPAEGVDTDTGGIIGDISTSNKYLKASVSYSFIMPADAEKSRKLYISGELYSERNSSIGSWIRFNYRLDTFGRGALMLDNVPFIREDVVYNAWTLKCTQYGIGTAIYAGLRNVVIS